jgi:hypothetical protein
VKAGFDWSSTTRNKVGAEMLSWSVSETSAAREIFFSIWFLSASNANLGIKGGVQ